MPREPARCAVHVDSDELLADALAYAHGLGLAIDAHVAENPFAEAAASPGPTLVAAARAPSPAQLAALADRSPPAILVIRNDSRLIRLAEAFGVAGLTTLADAMSCAAIVVRIDDRSTLSYRGLGAADRQRLPPVGEGKKRVIRVDDGYLATADAPEERLGRVESVDAALRALGALRSGPRPSMPRVEGADVEAARDALMGPARVLSDPASKSALEPYDLPLPTEELCGSASRASAEAARIGFPVRMTLASPDLRAFEHPDLVVEGVDGTARVREVFRELMALGTSHAPEARLLGVTVAASTEARCDLAIEARRIDARFLHARIGFADPHGVASADVVDVILPASAEDIAGRLRSLRGAALLAPEPGSRVVARVCDVALRIGAFLGDFPEEVAAVAIPRLVVLHGDELEIREARVEVTDAFERALR